ncbi:multidrug resistance-associated protein 5 [Tanacetum coccineum]
MFAPSGEGLILYQDYGNLYVMTGRKAYLLEDKQIPSVGVFDKVFSTWMEFGGNTIDLGLFGEETDKITNLHQIYEEVLFTKHGDGVAGIKRCRHDLSSEGVRDLATSSGSGRLKKDLESSTPTTSASVVNVENKDNWTLFLELLEQDLGTSRGIGLTFTSDQHKGLMEAVKDAMPNAEHRQCARHSYENFRKQYPRGCEAIENGFSECFNGVIVDVRHKPLLTTLEAIRVIMLERMNKMIEISRKWNPGVKSGSKGFTVDEGKRTCSCRMWLLSGIPFVHATKLIFLINRVPESYVPAWFETDMYFVAYHNFMKPILGMNFLPDKSMYSTVLPPKPRKIAGRPKKKRIRAIGEGGSSTRVSKRGPVRDEGARGSRRGASRFGGGASVSIEVASGSRGGTSGFGGASGSRGSRMLSGRCASGSRCSVLEYASTK